MGSSVYVASVQGYTGKSTVALGLLEQLSRRVGRVGRRPRGHRRARWP
jgi:phosphate acetyltransferase